MPNDWPSDHIALLICLYTEQPLAVDKLPYTSVFEAMVNVLNMRLKSTYHQHAVFGMLMSLRKLERLPLKR